MNSDELIDQITSREQDLNKAAVALKEKFIGIDSMIDSVISNISVWYCMPDLLTRPVIVNLWGMTGVGKTDLVRNLVNQLNMTDKFVEVQMSNKTQSDMTSMRSILERSSILSNERGVLLLDEIQRFRTIANNGEEISDYDFQDLWMLLSDGRFAGSFDTKTEIMNVLLQGLYYEDSSNSWYDEDSEDGVKAIEKKKQREQKRKYKQSYREAIFLKRKLRLNEEIEEIMGWDQDKTSSAVYEAMKNQSTFEGDSYSKLLIFVSGNLDEAYRMSSSTMDSDIDADILHEFSKKITSVKIKDVLRKRFKPEQISRLGNTHIIYPSLSKQNYKDIIKNQINVLIEDTLKNNIYVDVEQSVNDWIYRNGVFPAQGVRPVSSTISSMLGNSIPGFVLTALKRKENSISIKCEGDSLICQIGSSRVSKRIESPIDDIKKDKEENNKIITSVHEAGHAVAYASLFHIAPTQIIASTSSSDTDGYVGCHDINFSREYIRNLICIMLAGQVAEEQVFGEDQKTSGCSHDLSKATEMASKYVRCYGMDGYAGVHKSPYNAESLIQNSILNIDDIDKNLEQMIKDEKVRASQILSDLRPLFISLSETLMRRGEVTPEDYVDMADKSGLKIKTQPIKNQIIADYISKFEKFKN